MPSVVCGAGSRLSLRGQHVVSLSLLRVRRRVGATRQRIASIGHSPEVIGQRRLLCFILALVGGWMLVALPAVASTAPTTTTLTVTSGGSTVTTVSSGSVVTLTATVMAGSTALTVGQVNFCDGIAESCTDIHLLGTAQLTKTGTAFIKLRPGIGNHSYRAVFPGTPNGTLNAAASTSGKAALTVSGLNPTATTIAQSGSAGNYTLNAEVVGAGLVAPTGTVSFVDTSNDNAVLGTAPLVAGTAGLGFLRFSTPQMGYGQHSIAVGDFNGDGIPDLAGEDQSGDMVTVLLGNGDGTFMPVAVSPATGKSPMAIAVADFNGDGIPDLAVVNQTSETVTVLLGNGDGTFSPVAESPATGSNPYAIAVGDFNGDGKLDLAVANNGSNTVTVLLGNGDGTFTATATSPQTGESPSSIAVGDFSGDGKLDLVTTNGDCTDLALRMRIS